MAESIIFGAVSNILSKLSSPAVKELGLMWGVKEELEKLDDTLSAIQAVLLDVEEQLSQSNRAKNWVSRLKDVVYEIEDLMDECGYEALRSQVLAKDTRSMRKQVRTLFSIFKRPYSNLKLAHKIKHIRERLKAIDDDKNQFSFSPSVLHTSLSDHQFKKERETYSFIPEGDVIGRSYDKYEIINKHLLNTNIKHDIAIISIVGMGGLGKTALAQSVYNDDRITKYFELKLWVCVSEDFDVQTIAQKIIESATKKEFSKKKKKATKENPESSISLDSLANDLKKQIDGKKYLLVMDDVWNKDSKKWASLKSLLMGGAKGSRILITTRDKKVAQVHDTTPPHSLGNLDDFHSWLLFKKMTILGEEIDNSNLIKIGKEIVTKLKGVPLVIRTIGRLLREKKSEIFWLSFKDKELYQVIKQWENDDLNYMQSILKLSYNHLSSNLKQCFLYCALFPKDYEIQKDELILLWRAQGFIPPNEKDELIDIGEDYFLELLSKSFFQEVIDDGFGNIYTCKMHDLMHDLACSISNNECINGLKNNIDKRTRHFSLSSMSDEEFKELPKTLSKARNLRTFLTLYGCYLEEWESDYSRLRALKLSMSNTTTVLGSNIGRLKHLRYLSIWDLNLEYLPNCITELYNLETLSIGVWQGLKELPCDIKNLINLKHLYLQYLMNLKFLPDSIIELCKLEALIISCCYNLEALPRDMKKLTNLKRLDIRKCISIHHMPEGLGEQTNVCIRKE